MRSFLFSAMLAWQILWGATATSAGTWTPLSHTAPGNIGLMLLLTDGSVVAQNAGVSTAWYRLTPDIHGSYINGTWQAITPMHDTRLYGASDVLRDGRLFVAGGEYGIGKKTAEVYDPLCNAWTMAPVSGQSFSDSVSKVIADGNVLIAPVGPSKSGFTILFDIVSNVWVSGPKLFRGSYQDEASWVKLPDQSILTIDPFGTNSERYIPATDTWINDSTLPVQLYGNNGSELGGALLLPDGRAFVLGASGHTAYYTPSGSTSPGTWVQGPDIPNTMSTPDAAAAMMVNGKILCVASPLQTATNHFPSPTSFYEFDYTTNGFTQINGPTGATENNPTYYTTMLDLPDGTVLFAHFASQAYVYQPDGSPLAAGKPVITTITQNTNSSFHLVGTGLNGICEGAVYGDDFQMDSDYPLVRMTNSAGNVYYARTMNWSSTGVMTGSTPVSTDFTLPANLPAGSYSLVVVANGNASDPVTFDVAPIQVTLPASVTEGASPITGTVVLPVAATNDQVVNLTSSLPSRATVQANTTVPAGQTSGTFTLTIVNDGILEGPQAAMISASTSNYQGGLAYIVVNDDESASLSVTPVTTAAFSGNNGGPFTPSNFIYTLGNTGTVALNWSAAKGSSWNAVSPGSGTLSPGATTNVTVSITAAANTLAPASYSDTIIFDNTTTGNGDTSRGITLSVVSAPILAVQAAPLNASGFLGGPFNPSNVVMTISNAGTAPMTWTSGAAVPWLSLNPAGGTVAAGSNATTIVSLNSAADLLNPGNYPASVMFTNASNGVGNTNVPVALAVAIIVPPALAIASSNGDVVLSWLAGSNGFNYSTFVLQSTTNLDPSSWSNVAGNPVAVGGVYAVTNTISNSRMFYRLSH